jgi:hypothetical protein
VAGVIGNASLNAHQLRAAGGGSHMDFFSAARMSCQPATLIGLSPARSICSNNAEPSSGVAANRKGDSG